MVAWSVGVALATYVCVMLFRFASWDSLSERISTASCAALGTLALVQSCARARREGRRPIKGWIGTWILIAIDAFMSGMPFEAGQYLSGMLYLLAACGIGVILSYGLHIPKDPSIDWDEVIMEERANVKTASGGQHYEQVVTNFR